jgi:hypothetical protein
MTGKKRAIEKMWREGTVLQGKKAREREGHVRQERPEKR